MSFSLPLLIIYCSYKRMIYFPDTKLRCRDQNIVFFVVKRELRRIEAKMYTEVIQASNICRLFLYG